jgi:hypothetical protein
LKQKSRYSNETSMLCENTFPYSPQNIYASASALARPQCLLPYPDAGKENADRIPSRGARERPGAYCRTVRSGTDPGIRFAVRGQMSVFG